MIDVIVPHYLQLIILSLVAGLPLLLSIFYGFDIFRPQIASYLAWACLPAIIAIVCVPLDSIVEVPWFFMGGRMGFDKIGKILLSICTFIWILAGIAEKKRQARYQGRTDYNIFFLAAMAGNFGVILAQDILGFYLLYALMSFSAYGMIIGDGEKMHIRTGMLYLIFVIIGEVALFAAMVLLISSSAGLDLNNLADTPVSALYVILIYIGFGVKIGTLPFHLWMRSTYQATPAPSAAALSGAMINAGILGFIRFLLPTNIIAEESVFFFILPGILATFYGVYLGLTTIKPSGILAGSTVSQMGLVTVIIGIGLLFPESRQQISWLLVLWGVHHGLAKSSLFFSYGHLKAKKTPWKNLETTMLLLPAFSLAGLPFTSGAIIKTGLKELLIQFAGPWYLLSVLFLGASSLATTILMIHFSSTLLENKKPSNQLANYKTPLILSGGAAVLVLWLWPEARSYSIHSLAPNSIAQSALPIFLGWLSYFFWNKILYKEQKTLALPSNEFNIPLVRALEHIDNLKISAPKSSKTDVSDRLVEIFKQVIYFPIKNRLRKWEQIMGRWIMAGLFYLLLCLILFSIL